MANNTPFSIYIGEEFKPIQFSDVPINDAIDFYFIVAFARDHKNNDQRTNGLFQAHWDQQNLSSAEIEEIKNKHPNVKVLLSIGASDATFPFNPIPTESWLQNAVQSLVKRYDSLVNIFKFDGIDIHYNGIATTEGVFVNTVGHLISSIKAIKGSNFIVSISPSPGLDQYYLPLYRENHEFIDFVNYQFYAEGNPINSVNDFKSIYNSKRTDEKNYYDAKLLAGFSIYESRILSHGVFFPAVTDLKTQKKLGGIFIWSADNSVKRAQDILALP